MWVAVAFEIQIISLENTVTILFKAFYQNSKCYFLEEYIIYTNINIRELPHSGGQWKVLRLVFNLLENMRGTTLERRI